MSKCYQERLDQLKGYLRDHKIEAALVTSPINIYYLTGFFSDPHERFMALLIDLRVDTVKLIVPSLDQEAAQLSSYVKDIVPVSDTEDPYQILVEMTGANLRQLSVEKAQINLLQYERLLAVYSGLQLSNVEAFLGNLRSCKSPEDIEMVKRAVSIAEQVIEHGVGKVAVGVTELEIAAELEYQMKVLGADRPAFATTVLTGKRSALPHGKPSTEKIKEGDFLLIDLGVFVSGYCSDITRTFAIGKMAREQITIYQTVLEANRKAIQAVMIGQEFGSVDRAAREWIEAQGYGSYFIHRVGHGLGLEIHESPSIHALNQQKMMPGMLFTIEPGVYVPEVGGVRIEDDIYINEDGQVEILTTFPKELKNLC